MLHIDTPLPENLVEGDFAYGLSAEIVDLLFRKVNAMYDAQAQSPLRLTKSESGFLFTVENAA